MNLTCCQYVPYISDASILVKLYECNNYSSVTTNLNQFLNILSVFDARILFFFVYAIVFFFFTCMYKFICLILFFIIFIRYTPNISAQYVNNHL